MTETDVRAAAILLDARERLLSQKGDEDQYRTFTIGNGVVGSGNAITFTLPPDIARAMREAMLGILSIELTELGVMPA